MSSNRWSAEGDGWEFTWSPDPPHLRGTPRVVRNVARLLAPQADLAVTPVGPVVPSEISDPLAVLCVLRDAAGSPIRRTFGEIPKPPPVPDGAVS